VSSSDERPGRELPRQAQGLFSSSGTMVSLSPLDPAGRGEGATSMDKESSMKKIFEFLWALICLFFLLPLLAGLPFLLLGFLSKIVGFWLALIVCIFFGGWFYSGPILFPFDHFLRRSQ
jgi:hypothetical protein